MSRLAAVAIVAALLAGCVSVSVGNSDAPSITYYVLADARPATATAPAAVATARLAIQNIGGDPLADSTAMAYSRRSGERAFYQFAAWSERPARRLVLLAQQRLEARGRFASVTQLGQPVDSDWLLTLAVESMVHDVSVEPGRAQLTLHAELIHRRDRTRVARRTFNAATAVAEATAAAAVAAFATATADALDLLAEWAEATVAAQGRR